MDNIYRVGDLVEELMELPLDTPILVTIVKYPQDSMKRDLDDWDGDWDLGDDVEIVPLEQTYIKDGVVHLCTELTDYSEERREYLET